MAVVYNEMHKKVPAIAGTFVLVFKKTNLACVQKTSVFSCAQLYVSSCA